MSNAASTPRRPVPFSPANMSQEGPQSTPVIDARRVNFSFGDGELSKQILFDVNLQVFPGEIVLLTGPSGSGKTTLLTLLGGLRRLIQGELRVLEWQLQGASAAAMVYLRRSIGFIFQQHNLLGFLTARQNVEMMFQLHPEVSSAEAAERSANVLARVGLADRMDYLPAKLSGGQKQRVAVARALASGPRLILADEPTAALDSQTGRAVVDLLQELSRDNHIPILMVTHDNRVLDIADRVVNMEDGRLFEGRNHRDGLHQFDSFARQEGLDPPRSR